MIDYSKGILTGETLTPRDEKQKVVYACECGAGHILTVRHYEVVILKCGRTVWAIQRQAYGPLSVSPWPGHPMTARELAAKEAEERAEGWRAGRWTA